MNYLLQPTDHKQQSHLIQDAEILPRVGEHISMTKQDAPIEHLVVVKILHPTLRGVGNTYAAMMPTVFVDRVS